MRGIASLHVKRLGWHHLGVRGLVMAAAKHRGEHRVRALHQGLSGGAVVVPTDEHGERCAINKRK
jgi:hypothetical protein